MSEREKAREAIEVLKRLAAKREEQRKLEKELRRGLFEQGYDKRRAAAKWNGEKCAACGGQFYFGHEMLEFIDDNGKVVVRYHYHPNECGGFA